ncbi:hypothetical protein M0813_23222 [Anaeramoeba flamelloides]|uniref:Uncharacterized protein n=1 Tax=Anaeramoeba flamelloides TaxID=1746091 RepID=A0ABQ8Y9E5_9EUKA|nr:hypothetical protein M0813_23222 [Anaeramoeba flamelloides]
MSTINRIIAGLLVVATGAVFYTSVENQKREQELLTVNQNLCSTIEEMTENCTTQSCKRTAELLKALKCPKKQKESKTTTKKEKDEKEKKEEKKKKKKKKKKTKTKTKKKKKKKK